jgi:hypothetical protein
MAKTIRKNGILCLSMLIFCQAVTAQLHDGLNHSTVRIGNAKEEKFTVNALIWLPPGYENSKKYPLVIYGHGSGQAGADINKLYDDGLPAVLKEGFRPPFDCIIICPQRDSYGALPSWLPGILEEAGKRFLIDTTRIYLTGNSAGGFLCYGSQLNISQELANKFAAICVLSGATQDANQNNLGWWLTSKTPLWAIVGAEDQSFVRQNILITHALNQRVPGIARISIRDGIGHGGWREIYDGTFRDNGQNIWDWLYQYKVGSARVRPPTTTAGRTASAKATTANAAPGKATSTIATTGKAAKNKRILLIARDRQVYCTNVTQEYHPQPGDTLVVPKGILSFLLRNFSGEKNRPVVLLPEDSSWIGGYGPYSAVISNAKYFKVTGFHIDGQNTSNLGMAIASQTTDYEISHCSIRNTAAIGLLAKQDPDSTFPGGSWPGFTIRNVTIHDVDVSHTGTEGFYIGYTFDIIKPLASPLVNLAIYNITIDSTGWDGLQLSNCQKVKLHDIVIKDYGLKNEKGQQAGLLLGGMVTLEDSVYNVRVSNGTGAGLLVFGRGLMKFNKVRLAQVGMSLGENAIFINDYNDLGYDLPPLQIEMKNITVNGSSGNALEVVNGNGSMKPGRIENFSSSGTRGGIHTPSQLFIIK